MKTNRHSAAVTVLILCVVCASVRAASGAVVGWRHDATGKVIYEENLRLGGTAYPSVTLAGKYIYASSDNGATAVIELGRQFKQVARNKLETFRSSPVFIGRRMYIRGYKHLYCIGNESEVKTAGLANR